MKQLQAYITDTIKSTRVKSLSVRPQQISHEDFPEIEHFIVFMYNHTCPSGLVNPARQTLFAHDTRTTENIPPTQTALLEHTKRNAYQASQVWEQTFAPLRDLPPGDLQLREVGFQVGPLNQRHQSHAKNLYTVGAGRHAAVCLSALKPACLVHTLLCVCDGNCRQESGISSSKVVMEKQLYFQVLDSL